MLMISGKYYWKMIFRTCSTMICKSAWHVEFACGLGIREVGIKDTGPRWGSIWGRYMSFPLLFMQQRAFVGF
jgi:hypothetical protein